MLCVPIVLGTFAVMQGGINRVIASEHGLAVAALGNAGVIIVSGLLFFFSVKFFPRLFPHFFHVTSTPYAFQWWYIIPGLLGMCLVIGMPLAISKIGSAQMFVGMIGGQLVGSLLWDFFVEGVELSIKRCLAVLLTFLGVLLMSLGGRP